MNWKETVMSSVTSFKRELHWLQLYIVHAEGNII